MIRARPTSIIRPKQPLLRSLTDMSPSGVREWLKELCDRLSITTTELARRAGLAPSTLNRFIKDTDNSKNLSGRTLAALIRAAEELADVPEPIFNEAMDTSGDTPVIIPSTYIVTVPVVAAAVQEYRPEAIFDDAIYDLRIPLPHPYASRDVFGIEVSDSHAEPIFPFGSIVFCLSLGDLSRGPISDEYVVLAETDAAGLRRLTIRRFVFSPSMDAWAVPIRPESGLQDIFLGSTEEQWAARYKIIEGKVLSSYQPDRSIYMGLVGANDR